MLPEYKEELKDLFEIDIAPLMASGTVFTVTLDAYTDDKGTENYNIMLSRRRGAAVSKFLRDLGVPLDAIKVNSFGESHPVSNADTDEGRSLNRRVELRITKQK